MADLNNFFTKLIAEDLGVQPEQVTLMFIHEMRKKMYKDPDFQFDSDPTLRNNKEVRPNHSETLKRWNQKCRTWAQEVLQTGPTPCHWEPDPALVEEFPLLGIDPVTRQPT